MIVNKLNFSIIATKFLEEIKKNDQRAVPQYIDLWSEHNVTAIRLVTEGNISYSIIIDGEEISRIEGIIGDDKRYYCGDSKVITEKLLRDSHKYVTLSIHREVVSILDTVRDSRFTCSLLPGSLVGNVYTVETKNGNMRFIDIRQNDTLVYSAPQSAGYEGAMSQVLLKVLNETYLSNGLTISVP